MAETGDSITYEVLPGICAPSASIQNPERGFETGTRVQARTMAAEKGGESKKVKRRKGWYDW